MSRDKGQQLVLVLIAGSFLYLLLLTGIFLSIPIEGVAGNFNIEGLDVHHVLFSQNRQLERGDVVVRAGDRSLDEWAWRWFSEWPPTPNPWKPGQTVPFVIQHGAESLTVDITLDQIQPGVLLSRTFGQIQIYTSIVFLVVGALILWRCPHEQAAQLWFASSLCLFVVSIDTELVEFQVGLLTHRWIFWLRTADLIFYWLTFSFGLHFFLVFPERSTLLDRFPQILPLQYLLFPAVVVLGTVLLASSVLDGLFWLRRLIFLMGGIYLLLGSALLLQRYRTTQSITTRKQLNIVVWGTLIGLFPYIFLYSIPLALTGRPLVPPNVSALVMLLMPVSLAIAIIRYRLFEIDALLNRGLVYAFLGTLVVAVFAVIFLAIERLQPDWPWVRPLIDAVIVLITIAVFAPLRARLQHGVDHLLYGSWYDYRSLVMETSQELSRASDVQQLNQELLAIAESMRFGAAALLYPDMAGYTAKDSFGYTVDLVDNFHIPLDGALVGYLTGKARPLDRETIADDLAGSPALTAEEQALLSQASVPTWLPLVTRETLPGILLLGTRQEKLAKRDLDILATVASQAAVAADNVNLIATLRAQLTEVEQAQEELTMAQQRITESREGERLRMARELHDGPIQDLQGIRLRLNLLSADGNKGSDAALSAAQREILQVIEELRVTCQELRPPSLGPFGLGAAMRSFAGRFQETHPEIQVHLDLMRDRQMIPERERLGLFRIYQEALNNAAQHAEAHNIHIQLFPAGDAIHLEIKDDGRGFQIPRRWTMLAREGHLGLLGAAERAESIDGHLRVISEPGQGTLVHVTFPCETLEVGGLETPVKSDS